MASKINPSNKPYGIWYESQDVGEFYYEGSYNSGWVKRHFYKTRKEAITGLKRLVDKNFLSYENNFSWKDDNSAVHISPESDAEFDVPGAAISYHFSMEKFKR